ncbi:MAG: efflux RND transporter permease subunit [Burkholderiales bacterium]
MIGSAIRWSLQNRFPVLLLAALVLVWGAFEASRMPVDVFPDLTAPTVTVVTEAHGMSPAEVETVVTFPIETALNGAAGVRRVRSVSDVGISVVIVEFEWDVGINQARQVVTEKMQLARAGLPPELVPTLAPVASVMGEIMFIALRSEKHGPMDLKTTADWVLRRRLLAVPGVAEVIPVGGDTRQYQVVASPERLAAYKVTVGELLAAVKSSNVNAAAGFYSQGGQEYLIQGFGRVRSAADIGESAIAVRDGVPVLVRQVAEVTTGAAPKRGTASQNGRPAVVLGIQKQPGANTLELTHRLDQVLAEIQRSLPAGMTIETKVFRQADFIATSIRNLLDALRDGAVLVVAIVLLFLWSARATAITLLALPLSLVAAILAMKALGATINTMTLGGMAIALGALVDDAIIVVENIVRRLRQALGGAPAASAAVVESATLEIQGSIVFATLIIGLVFLPLFFLEGVEGRLLVPLGFAYVVALAASLVVAVTVTPVLALLLLPRSAVVRRREEPRFASWLKARYAPLLERSVGRWKILAAASAAFLVAAIVAFALAGRSFLPSFNEGALTVAAVTLPGTSLEESDRLGRWIERILLEQPEVASTARRTGRAERDPHAQAIYASEVDVSLREIGGHRDAFLGRLRKALAVVPGTAIVIGQPISHRIDHLLSGTRANIAVKIFGPDLYELRRIAGEVAALARDIPGAVDVSAEKQTDIPQLAIRFRRDAIARHGLTVGAVAEAVEAAFAGASVSRVVEGQAVFDLVVRYDPAARESDRTIRAALITTPAGARVPLEALAEVVKDASPNVIARENVQRKIVVMANVSGRDLGSVVGDIRDSVARRAVLPPGYYIEYGGQFESAERASARLAILGTAVVVGIFVLLSLAFRSARDALLVMVNLPLALIGGVIGLYASGGVVSIATLVGFITLFGIATRNGVMLVAHIRQLQEREGVADLATAVKRGAEERLIPILMTALAAGLALIPLALSAGAPGSEIQSPMAVVILFGLLSSTALNAFVLPALYLRFGARGVKMPAS